MRTIDKWKRVTRARNRPWWRSLACALSLSVCVIAYAQHAGTVEVEMEGSAPGSDADARSEAIHNAQTTYLIDELEMLTGSPDFSLLDPFLKQATRYFSGTRVTKHSKIDDETHVEVKARFHKKRLREDLTQILWPHLKRRPVVLILIEDTITPNAPKPLDSPSAADAILANALRLEGIKVLDPAKLREDHSVDVLKRCIEEEADYVARIADSIYTDIAIVGHATSVVVEDSTNPDAFKRIRSTVSLRVIRARDGVVFEEPVSPAALYSADVETGGVQAIEDATERLVPTLASSIVLGTLYSPPTTDIVIYMDKPFKTAQAEELIAYLQDESGAKIVAEPLITPDLASVRIRYSGSVGQLLDDVTQHTFSDFRLEAATVIHRDVRLRVLNAGGDTGSSQE